MESAVHHRIGWVLFVHLALIFIARHEHVCQGFGLFYLVVWSAEQNV